MNPDPAPDNRSSEKQFTLHQVIDRQHNNVVVSVFEYPADWQARSNVVWNFHNMSVPVLGYAQTFNPQGTESVEFLPAEYFFWINEAYGYYQQGQNVMGQVCLPPMSAADAMTRWVVPKYRGNRANLKIVGVGTVPHLAQRIGLNLSGAASEDVSVKLEYWENGKLFEEELYGVKLTQNVPYYGPQGMMMQINWGFARLFSFRAEKGALNAKREVFWRIACSVKLNPLWEQLYARVLQQLKVQFDQYIQAGYSQIQAAAQLSNAISANNDAWLNSFEQQRQAAWQSSSARSDSSGRSPNDAFDDYIRGVETVNDPYYGESQQDYNYQYHWTDGSGSYQHSNDPFFNPNIGSTQNWTIMEPKKS
jgi:hypothetical protein